MLGVDINYLAVLVAAIAYFVLGGLWYSPVLFGNMWKKAMNIKDGNMKGLGKVMAGGFVANLLTTYVMAVVLGLVGVATFAVAAQVAFWMWLGFMAPMLINSVLYEGKSWNLFIINAAYQLIGLSLAAGIVAIWV